MLNLTSSAFENDGTIPEKYTGDGDNVSPPLSWSLAPDGTKSFALICDDPDAPGATWVHWVIYNIPADVSELPEAVADEAELSSPKGALQGTNDFVENQYGGPAPPPGPAHRYFFKIYALDTMIDLDSSSATKDELLSAIEGHILASGELIGKYGREK